MQVRDFTSTPENLSVIAFHVDGLMQPLSFELDGWKNVVDCALVEKTVDHLTFDVVHQNGNNVLVFDRRFRTWSVQTEATGTTPGRSRQALRGRSFLQVIDGGVQHPQVIVHTS